MKLRSFAFVLGFVGVASGAFGQAMGQPASVDPKVFGISFAQPMKPAPSKCPRDFWKSANICWLSGATIERKGAAGAVHFPDGMALPAWAVNGHHSMVIGENGVARRIRVETFDDAAKHEIARSITTRFGLPEYTTLPNGDPAVADWNHPDVFTSMMCTSGKCAVEFRSRAEQAEVEARRAAYRAKEAARPKTP